MNPWFRICFDHPCRGMRHWFFSLLTRTRSYVRAEGHTERLRMNRINLRGNWAIQLYASLVLTLFMTGSSFASGLLLGEWNSGGKTYVAYQSTGSLNPGVYGTGLTHVNLNSDDLYQVLQDGPGRFYSEWEAWASNPLVVTNFYDYAAFYSGFDNEDSFSRALSFLSDNVPLGPNQLYDSSQPDFYTTTGIPMVEGMNVVFEVVVPEPTSLSLFALMLLGVPRRGREV